MYPKDKILELYLNKVYFGDGLYGAEAASRGYFGKHASELTVAEAAMLAGLVKSPSSYAPTVGMDRAIARRNVALEAMLETVRRARNVKTAVAERLGRGEPIDGFGHPLYRTGDPRAVALLSMLRERYAKSAELAFVINVADAAASAIREKPNVDFALAAVARVLRLPSGSPLTIFAIGRTIGWIGHAIEQYETGQLIRPRAKYVGVVPSQ